MASCLRPDATTRTRSTDWRRTTSPRSRRVSKSPWATAETDFVYPQTRGERPKDFAGRLQYGAALTRLMADDPEVHRTVVEVVNLVRPLSALREPELVDRVMALMKAAA